MRGRRQSVPGFLVIGRRLTGEGRLAVEFPSLNLDFVTRYLPAGRLADSAVMYIIPGV
jgi:hypothetical protein